MLSLNAQPAEKPDLREDGSLDVFKVWPTIQGEGPFVGRPAVFVRTAGCSILCPSCDTDYTSIRNRYSVRELLFTVKRHARDIRSRLVVLTGGEPFRQNIMPFVWAALDEGLEVQAESNGTLAPPEARRCNSTSFTVVCSPKTGSINHKLHPLISAYKYVLQAGKVDPEDGLPTDSLGMGVRVARPHDGFGGEVFVQPTDEGDPQRNVDNVATAVWSCLQFGYRLSVQIHKIAGLE